MVTALNKLMCGLPTVVLRGKSITAHNMALCVSGHEVRTEKVFHLVNFIAGMQLVVSKAHQRKAPFVRRKQRNTFVI